MDIGNSRTVWVVQVDNTKDMSEAKKFGQLRAVFGKPRKPYDTASMLSKARHVLKDWQSGDYLLLHVTRLNRAGVRTYRACQHSQLG